VRITEPATRATRWQLYPQLVPDEMDPAARREFTREMSTFVESLVHRCDLTPPISIFLTAVVSRLADQELSWSEGLVHGTISTSFNAALGCGAPVQRVSAGIEDHRPRSAWPIRPGGEPCKGESVILVRHLLPAAR